MNYFPTPKNGQRYLGIDSGDIIVGIIQCDLNNKNHEVVKF
jgi:hypothetical protein